MDTPVRVDRFVWERLMLSSGLPPATCQFLLVLGVYMSQDGSSARPGLEHLCQAAGKRRSVAINHLRAGVGAGYLRQVERGGRRGGEARASEYAATVPADVYARARDILNGPPWRRRDDAGTADQPPPDAPPTSDEPDVEDPPADVPTSDQPDVDDVPTSDGSDLGNGPQRPTGRTLDGPTSDQPDIGNGFQGPVFEPQRPTGRTPPRSTHHALLTGDLEGSVTEVDAREAPPTPSLDLDRDDWDPRCTRHRRDPDPPPCRPCGERRRSLDARQAAAERARKAAQSAERSDRAAADRAAIDACRLCDEDGYRGLAACHHDPDADARRARGSSAVRAVLAARREAS